MKISELQTGMKVVLRNHDKGIIVNDIGGVLKGVYICTFRQDTKKWDCLKTHIYDEKLNYILSNSSYDIIEVFTPKNIYSVLNFINLNDKEADWELIWNREKI